MAYSTLTDLKKLIPEETLIQLTDDEEVGQVNIDRINEAIACADAEIDCYAAVPGYTVPLSPIPDIVRKLSVDIAIYNLYSRRIEVIPETRHERYQNAIKQLESISKGIIKIGETGTSEPIIIPDGNVKTNKAYSDRVFTQDTMRGF